MTSTQTVTEFEHQESLMPAIKPRSTQKYFVRHITRLYHENNEALFAYAAFLDERTEYVLNQLIDTVLVKDRDFQQWRAEHPASYVPPRGSRKSRRKAQPMTRADHRPAAETLDTSSAVEPNR